MMEPDVLVHETSSLQIVFILTAGFTLAGILGYVAQRIHFSPLIGYLFAGYLIGPFFPALTINLILAEQLAEIGVILMMFGVGLHFKWQDLVKVKNIAIVGALTQTSIATLFTVFLTQAIGWSWESGVIIGLSIGVASTVVLVRVLSDQNLLHTPEGHIAVGWLIAEDVLIVITLVLLPSLVTILHGNEVSFFVIAKSTLLALSKFFLLIGLMFTIGRKIVGLILYLVAKTRSSELFTLTLLALIFSIATGSALLFGTSITLGAFISGMVIGQTDVRHQADVHASPMKDAFLVIFFLSVGMLFNPSAIIENFPVFISIFLIVTLIKPLSAFIIALLFHYSLPIAFTLAIALAQIGEFSFILAAAGLRFKLIPDESYDIIVACALISIAINPLLFKLMNFIQLRKEKLLNHPHLQGDSRKTQNPSKGILVGFGGIGPSIIEAFDKMGIQPIIIDRDLDAIAKLIQNNYEAIYAMSTVPSMFKTAQLTFSQFLVITDLELSEVILTIVAARKLQPHLLIFVHVRHIEDKLTLRNFPVDFICCDDQLSSSAMSKELLKYWQLGQS